MTTRDHADGIDAVGEGDGEEARDDASEAAMELEENEGKSSV
jgi:hypothetical protein